MTASSAPLAGIRVLDFSIMAAGPWAGALLGMLGAEVIKVEPPNGDGTRFGLPKQRGMGTNYIAMNVNKKGVVLDLKTPEGLDHALKIAATCDIVIQNLRVGVMDRLGMGYEALRKLNPRLVYCSISGFGERGSLAKAGCGDPTMQAFSGFARCNGPVGESVEAFRFTGLLDLITGTLSTALIQSALLERDTTGEGQHIDVSMLEAALEAQVARVADYVHAGLKPTPLGSESEGLAPDRAFATLDREIFVTVRNADEWKGFCAAIGQPALVEDARFATNRDRVENRNSLNAILVPVFRSRPAIWWMRVFQRYRVPVSIAHHFETFRYHEQVTANGHLTRLRTRDWGELTVAGLPWHFSATPCHVEDCCRPGEDTAAVLAALPAVKPEALPLKGAAKLAGLKVVEFAQGIAGPLAGLHLAELGATVIKVEPPGGDWLRGAAPVMLQVIDSAAFFEINRGKRSVLVGEDQGAATQSLAGLLASADVFITDLTDEQLGTYGVDVERLSERGPKGLVTVVVSPWGPRGPWAGYPGSELTVQAMAGYTRYLGVHGEPAVRLGPDVASVGAGLFALQAVLAALHVRNRTGRGQRVDVSLLGTLLALKTVHVAAQSDPDSYEGPRVGCANHDPEQGWSTGTNPVFFKFGGSMGGAGREGWVDFVKSVGLEHMLDDPRCDRIGKLTTGHGLYAHDVRPLYNEGFSRFSADEVAALIRQHGGDVAIYLGLDDTLAHPQTAALGLLVDVAAADGISRRVRQAPGRYSALQRVTPDVAPTPGADTADAATIFGNAGGS